MSASSATHREHRNVENPLERLTFGQTGIEVLLDANGPHGTGTADPTSRNPGNWLVLDHLNNHQRLTDDPLHTRISHV
ncbi:hypothetical protein SAMN04487785_105195 [Dyella jiangningensis]|nr:hypothetical protein BDW41_106124 [Dyella sp. AtDHG13]SDK10420.1 hypothetical protein SAMN04487785_105195 [Dyella jiangningensis]